MTLDCFVALSLLPRSAIADWPARLAAGDPLLLDLMQSAHVDACAALASPGAGSLQCLAWADAAYPERLRTIPDPPPVLWLRGDPSAWTGRTVAVVGSRSAGPAAREVAATLSEGLGRAGVTVVSGLARGVDAAAHRGSLVTGRTVAVLGCGADVVYPASNGPLAEEIVQAGCLVSELPPGMPPLAHHFPLRNRIISGMSDAVVVVEAAARSGSLITARLALDQGREVMAVPGAVPGGRNQGAHALIRDGAALVECAEDVLRELGWEVPSPGPGQPGGGPAWLSLLRVDESRSLDELADRTGLSAQALLVALLDLELAGLVRRADDGGFMRAAGTCYRN